MRIALGAFQHEANSFCPQPTTLASFERNRLRRGAQVIQELGDTATEEAGALAILRAEPDCELAPLLSAKAGSGAPIAHADYLALRDELLDRLRSALPVDGVLLVLHGAMMTDAQDDATGDLLEAVRSIVGPGLPVVGTLDLHANVTQRMAHQATALVGYHTAPHIDLYETGQAAARILLATVKGERNSTCALQRLPLIVPAENARHTDGPLSDVINTALGWEHEGAILHGGVYAVQPWLDAADVGCSVLVVTDGDADGAQRRAHALAAAFWERRDAFQPELVPPDEAVRRALGGPERTVVLCDSADAPSSGSTGDSTVVLGAVLRTLPTQHTVLLNVVDPEVVAQAIEVGVGNTLAVQVGGRRAPGFFEPVPFEGYVKSISDGRFRFKGPGMRGVEHSMGRTAVLVQGGVHLLVMERPCTQWDPELYRSQGLEPSDARIVQVKSPAAFRAAYAGIADDVLIVDSPGPASPHLTALPWKRLGRPIYPLDPETRWP